MPYIFLISSNLVPAQMVVMPCQLRPRTSLGATALTVKLVLSRESTALSRVRYTGGCSRMLDSAIIAPRAMMNNPMRNVVMN